MDWVEQLWLEHKEINETYNHFEDTGVYYANQVMVDNHLALSMDSHLVYNISDAYDVKLIMKATDSFFSIAQKDIAKDGPCFYSKASIFKDGPRLIWEL